MAGVTAPARTHRDRAPTRSDRRARRRQETIEEILDIADEVMTEEGVNGLSLAEVARRLGVQPPSIYKYFPSLMAVYDALFLRGQLEHLEVMRDAMADAAARAARVDGRARGQRALGARPPGRRRSCCSGVPSRASSPHPRRSHPASRWSPCSAPPSPTRSRPDSSARSRLRRSGLPRLDAHRRRAQPGHGQRAGPRMGRGTLHPHCSRGSWSCCRQRFHHRRNPRCCPPHFCQRCCDWAAAIAAATASALAACDTS